MQVQLFVLAFFFVATFSDEDCGCTSASADRENLFECVETFLPYSSRDDFYDENRGLIADGKQARALVRLYARDHARASARMFARVLARGFQARAFQARNFQARNNQARNDGTDMFARAKRSDADEICSCLTSTKTCLDGSTCSSALPILCNVASGRVFGVCAECDGLVNLRDRYQTAEQITEKIISLADSLLQYIESRTTSVSDINLDYTSGTLHLSFVASNGAEHSVALNNIVYFLSKALDVVPGSISYDITNKRQDTVTARLIVVSEEDIVYDATDYSAGSSVTVGVMAVAALVLRFF